MANEATVYGQRIPTSKGNEDDPRTGADGSISVDPNLAEKIKGENLNQRLHRLSIQEKDSHTQAYIVQPKMDLTLAQLTSPSLSSRWDPMKN